ncbi:MAG: hypothetical protein LBO74_05380 [Candidatus Symbiothrix sp.]|jgi:hypothetical protein|nr:hypothetical protein [Candidatus Symbiothrix sp.]
MKTNKSILVTLLVIFLSASMVSCSPNKREDPTIPEKIDGIVPPEDENTVTSKNSFNIGEDFFPYGYMGCTKKISLNPAYSTDPHSASKCFKIEFTSSCDNNNGWAGVYWTNKENNWGERPGRDFSKSGFTKITFWAKGNKGGEMIEFGSGGIDETPEFQYKDSYEKCKTREILTNKWTQYSINLSGADLSSVIGGFYWSAEWQANPNGVIFYLDDIQFE